MPCISFPGHSPCVKVCRVNLSPWLALQGYSPSSEKEREGPFSKAMVCQALDPPTELWSLS